MELQPYEATLPADALEAMPKQVVCHSKSLSTIAPQKGTELTLSGYIGSGAGTLFKISSTVIALTPSVVSTASCFLMRLLFTVSLRTDSQK